MSKPKGELQFNREERGRREHAARVAREAVARINEVGLVKTAEFRFSSGITLDRALEQEPFGYQDLGQLSFPAWLSRHDVTFTPSQLTIGAWADGHTQGHVLQWLEEYIADLGNHSLVRPVVQAPRAA